VRVTAKAVDGHFNVSVTDTGPGIPEEHQARIFEQFHQVDSSNTEAKGGTGLGLAIAKQIVEVHGGPIWVESTLGRGSTFQMDLPARPELGKGASGGDPRAQLAAGRSASGSACSNALNDVHAIHHRPGEAVSHSAVTRADERHQL